MPFPVYPLMSDIKRLQSLVTNNWNKVGEVCKVHLFKNDVTPDMYSESASFVEATFDGYAAIALAMGVPFLNDQGVVVSQSALCTWASAAGDPTETIYGIYITDDEANELVCAQRFEEPQTVGGVFPQAISGVFRTTEPYSSLGWLNVEG